MTYLDIAKKMAPEMSNREIVSSGCPQDILPQNKESIRNYCMTHRCDCYGCWAQEIGEE